MEPTSFDLQPELTGILVRLRPLQRADFAALYECASDPLIWEQHPQSNRYQREVFQGFFGGAMASGGAFAILEKATGKIIGSSRYYDLKAREKQVTIGYTFLARLFWGGQFNRELKNLMLAHAFQFVDNVMFEVGESNARSRRALEKIGARLFARGEKDGKTHLTYRLVGSEFQQ